MRRPPEPVPRLGWRAGLALALVAFGIRAAVVLATGPSQPRFADALRLSVCRSVAGFAPGPIRCAPRLSCSGLRATRSFSPSPRSAIRRASRPAASRRRRRARSFPSCSRHSRRGSSDAGGSRSRRGRSPPSIRRSSSVSIDIQTEALFLLFLLASGFLLLAAADRPSSNLAVLSGAGLALAALTRSSALALVPFLAAPLFDSRHPRRVNAHVVGSALLGFVLVLGPWTARNALVFRRAHRRQRRRRLPLLWPEVRGGSGTREGARPRRAPAGRRRARALARTNRRESAGGRARFARKTLAGAHRRRARTNGAPTRPGRSSSWAGRPGLGCAPTPIHDSGRGASSWVSASPSSILDLVAAIGLTRGPRRGCARFCVAFLAATMLFHVAMGASWRYRTTSWDPILLLYGAFGAVTLRAGRRWPENAAT